MNRQLTSPDPAALEGGRGWLRPELLAPAGDWECARAAVENGADAIYFGLDRFNARMRAQNFTKADLAPLMQFLHRRGVKGYLTFNTLVFADEMAEAERFLRAIVGAGVDAAIVQDVGICRLIRRISPDFPIHASTQMTVTSAAGIEFARELGCQLVVLARECSLKEIEKIQSAQSSDGGPAPGMPMPLEVFVHGALCVAYSGQCLTSEALGGRSANRGECAQACRMPYELIADGQTVPLGDRRYLLSPQDLAGLELLPDLIRAGVSSLKIEGRLKSPEYVASITRVYREELDRVMGTADTTGEVLPVKAAARYEMEMAFSRGLSTGWFQGINNQQLVHARFGKKRGVFLGEVRAAQSNSVRLRLVAPLKPGDGVVFDAGHPDRPEEGGRVFGLRRHGAETVLEFARGAIRAERIHIGDKVWKTSDPELDRRLRRTFSGNQPLFARPLRIEVSGSCGEPLEIAASDKEGHTAIVRSSMPLVAAGKQPLDETRLRDQLGRLGGTGFCLRELKNRLEGAVLIPISELNRLRRQLVGELDRERSVPPGWTLNPKDSIDRAPVILDDDGTASLTGLPATPPELALLVRTWEQFEAALRCGVNRLYCEFEDPRKYRAAVVEFRKATAGRSTSEPPPTIWVAPPRIFKTGEEWILKQIRSCEADGYLIRNYDQLRFFERDRKVGDFSLNIANPLAAEYFVQRYHLERITPSYDLNILQLEALLNGSPGRWYEVTIHQHMPMFHMEHCVFCAFLSKGTDYTNCGRPCDRHEVTLRDRVGAAHPLKADAGCRNTLFNARAQTGAEYVGRLIPLGVRSFRIELVNESTEETRLILSQYRRLLDGSISGGQLWRELKLVNQLGVTRGQMEGASR